MSKEVKENELFRIIDERINENDEKGIDSIVMISPDKISVIGVDPLEMNVLHAYKKK